MSDRTPVLVPPTPPRLYPVCFCLTAGWRCSGGHGAGPLGPVPSGRCSGWPLTAPATARGACSPPAPAQRTEGQRGRRHQAGTGGSFFQQLNAPHCPKRGKACGTDRGRSVSTQQSLENIIMDINLSWEEVRVCMGRGRGGGAIF